MERKINNILYQDNKIYVVVIVLLMIFIAIIFYLWRIDNKISKLEKRNQKKYIIK